MKYGGGSDVQLHKEGYDTFSEIHVVRYFVRQHSPMCTIIEHLIKNTKIYPTYLRVLIITLKQFTSARKLLPFYDRNFDSNSRLSCQEKTPIRRADAPKLNGVSACRFYPWAYCQVVKLR